MRVQMPQIYRATKKSLIGRQTICFLVSLVCVTTFLAGLLQNTRALSADEKRHSSQVPYTAYVLSMDKDSLRSKHTEKTLNTVGFKVEYITPQTRGNAISDKLWSNKMAFLNLLEKYLESNSTSWLYIFEDDITAHSGTSLQDIRDIEARSTKFVYLGICGTSVQFFLQSWTLQNQGKCGTCAHAMGFSRKGAQEFMAFSQEKTDMNATNFDVVVAAWCLSLGGFPVLRFDLRSPQIEGHRGVFFQDRLKFATSIV